MKLLKEKIDALIKHQCWVCQSYPEHLRQCYNGGGCPLKEFSPAKKVMMKKCGSCSGCGRIPSQAGGTERCDYCGGSGKIPKNKPQTTPGFC